MAFYPCSNHHFPYRGPSFAAYPALVNGTTSDRKHLRMCEPCFDEYLQAISERLEEVSLDGTDSGELQETWACSWCRQAAPWRIYVNAYPKKESGRLFFGAACDLHEPQARSLVLLS